MTKQINFFIPDESNTVNKDFFFGASVAELRRKAQEHSAALWHSLQLVHQQTSASLPNAPNPFLTFAKGDAKDLSNFSFLPNVPNLTGFSLAGFPPGLAGLSGDAPPLLPGSRQTLERPSQANSVSPTG